MNYKEFLAEVVRRGTEGCTAHFSGKRKAGAIAGFQACLDKEPDELRILLEASATATRDAHENDKENYWWFRFYEVQVEWVCNVISAVIMNQKWGRPIVPPTARAYILAQSILTGTPVENLYPGST